MDGIDCNLEGTVNESRSPRRRKPDFSLIYIEFSTCFDIPFIKTSLMRVSCEIHPALLGDMRKSDRLLNKNLLEDILALKKGSKWQNCLESHL